MASANIQFLDVTTNSFTDWVDLTNNLVSVANKSLTVDGVATDPGANSIIDGTIIVDDVISNSSIIGDGTVVNTSTKVLTVNNKSVYTVATLPASLNSIKNVTPANNKVIIYTSTNTASLADVNVFGLNLANTANSLEAQTLLNLDTIMVEKADNTYFNDLLLTKQDHHENLDALVANPFFVFNDGGGRFSYPGSIGIFAMDDVQDGWLECNGAEISRSTYSVLFSRIGTTYGAGNGTTTFNIPDYRGIFLRGWDHGRGLDSGRNFGDLQEDAIKSHTHTATTASAGAHTHSWTGTAASAGNHSHQVTTRFSDNGGGAFKRGDTNQSDLNSSSAGAHTHSVSGTAASNGAHTHTITVANTGSTETRPKNIALMFCIKY